MRFCCLQGAGCVIRLKSSHQSARKFLVTLTLVSNETSSERFHELLGEFFTVPDSQIGIASSAGQRRQGKFDATIATLDDWDLFVASLQGIQRALVAFLGASLSMWSFVLS